MNDTIKKDIDKFLDNALEAGKELENLSKTISSKEENIKKLLGSFNDSFKKLNANDVNEDFKEKIEKTLSEYTKKIGNWNKKVEDYIDGIEFISLFEKSVLVVVFGNVNVGKSSLGNFVAGSVDELKEYYNETQEYFVYDFAEENKSNKQGEHKKLEEAKFREDYKEATTTIQYYTLKNGFTWVDTPGIHSINSHNEELAKKYVDYSELVIFVLSSSSPGKYTELMELKKLMNNKKPLLIVFNKSDENEEDEDENGEIIEILMPKSDSTRKMQEEDTLKRLNTELMKEGQSLKDLSDDIEIISVSTLVAREALKNNNLELFNKSGIPRFYEKLGQTLSSDAKKLKLQAPKERVNSLIDEIINPTKNTTAEYNKKQNDDLNSVSSMISEFENIKKQLNESIKDIKELKESIFENVKNKSQTEIDILMSRSANSVRENKESKNVQKEIEDVILRKLNTEVESEISKHIKNFEYEKVNNLNISGNFELKVNVEKHSYDEVYLKTVNRAPNGFFETIGSFFGKEYTTTRQKTKTITVEKVTGDNSDVIMNEVFSRLEDEVMPVVKKTLDKVTNEYFNKELEIVNKALDYTNKLKNDLENEIIK